MVIPAAIDKNRFKEIVSTLGKYGLAEWLGPDRPEFIEKQMTAFDGRRISELSREERFRYAITELGTTFIKLGQVLSTRADLVDAEVAKELDGDRRPARDRVAVAEPGGGAIGLRSAETRKAGGARKRGQPADLGRLQPLGHAESEAQSHHRSPPSFLAECSFRPESLV